MHNHQDPSPLTQSDKARLVAHHNRSQGFWVNKFFSSLGSLALLVVGFLKFGKYLFWVLKLAKFQSLLTMFLAVWVYSLSFGWPFAAGFVLLIFVHEMGHALALKREGISFGAPIFIPFLGAVIAMKGQPRNAWVEAKVALGGPLLGGFGALLVLGHALSSLENSNFWFALAQTGFLINLFNMIPVSPMDGGRIAGGVSRYFLILGLGLGAMIFYYYLRTPLLFLILILGGLRVWQSFKSPVPGYFDIPSRDRIWMGASYLVLLFSLFKGYEYSSTYISGFTFSQTTTVYISPLLFCLASPFYKRM